MTEVNSSNFINPADRYSQSYSDKCAMWKSQPVYDRKRNDICCCVWFFLSLILFVAVGIYFILQYKKIYDPTLSHPNVAIINDDPALYFKLYIGKILGSLTIVLVLNFLYVLAIKTCPTFMVYFLIILSFISLAAAAITLIIYSQIYASLCLFFVLIVYSVLLFCFQKQLKIGIIMVKVSTVFLSQRLSVFIAPTIKILLTVGLAAYWSYSVMAMIYIANDKSSRGESPTLQYSFIGVWSLLWLLFTFLFYYIMVFTVAVAVAFWYYRIERNYFTTAYRWIFTSSFGSLVFAATLIAVIKCARMFTNKSSSRSTGVAICLCFLSWIIRGIEELVTVLNHLAVIVMSVTGEDYIEAAKTTVGLVMTNVPLLTVSQIITNFIVFWGVVTTTGATTFLTFLIVKGDMADDVNATIIIVGVSCLVLSSLVLSIIVESVSAVYIFYCFDIKFRELGYHTNNMPQDIYCMLNQCNK